MSASKLKCLLFCEFDPKLGPQIAYQAPDDFVRKDQMDDIVTYIITKPLFQQRLISIKAYGYTFMGYPVVIEDKKYERNELIFNTVFVFNELDEVHEYEPVVKKLAAYLTTLELESEYLSKVNTKANLPNILAKILQDFSSTGECTIPVDPCNTIFLKVVKLPKEPPVVFDHLVPVFLWSKSAVESQHWDLTAQHVIPHIDGFNHVQKIASVTEIDLGLVRSAIQTLLFHGVVALIPIFLYSNMYAVTPKIHSLHQDTQMKVECVAYVSKDDQHLANFRDIFMLYCALGPGLTVSALCSRHNLTAMRIDEQRLLQYGLIKQLIRKLNKFPVLLTTDTQRMPHKSKENSQWFNGYYNYEEICCKSATAGEPINYEDIDKLTENDPYVVHIWK